MSIEKAREQAKQMMQPAVDALRAREDKIKQVADALQLTYAKAEGLVKQEEARRAAGEKYRQSEAYKQRLQQQKLVRQLLKGGN